MAGDLFPDNTLRLLEKSLNWHTQGQEVIAGNLANLETPNYTRKEVNFRQVLKDHLQGKVGLVLAATHPRHLPNSRFAGGLVRDTGAPVDLDQEMVSLSLNQLGYQTSVTMLKKKLEQLRAAIEGGRI